MSTPESSTIEEEIEGESDSLSSSHNTERVLSSAEDRRDSEDSLNVTGRSNSEDSLSPERHTLEKQETEQKEKDPNEVTEGGCRQKEKDSKGGDNQVEEEQTRSQDRMKDVNNMETVVEAMETDIQEKTIRKEEVEEKANQKQINTITLEVGQIIYAPIDPFPISTFVPTRQNMATDNTEPDGTKGKSDGIPDVIEGKSTVDKDDRINDDQNNIYTTQPPLSLSGFASKRHHLDDDDDGTEPDVMKDKTEGITDEIEETSTDDKDDVVYYNQTNIYNIPSSLSLPLLDPARQDLHTDNIEPDISKNASQEITEIGEMTTTDKDETVHNVVGEDFYNTESPLSLSMFVAARKDLDIGNTEFDGKKDNSHRIPEITDETATPDKVDVVDYGQKDFYNTHLKDQLATYGDYKKYEQTTMADNQCYHNDDDDDDEHIGSVSENDDDEKEKRPNGDDDDDFKSEKSFFRTSIFPSLSTPDVSALYEKPSAMDRGVSEELLPSYHDNDRYSIWPRMELVQSTTLKHFKPPNPTFSTKANSFKAPNPKFSTRANSFKHPAPTSTSLPSLRWSYQDLRASDLFEESTDKLATNMKVSE